MNNLSQQQLIIALAFYYFGYPRSDPKSIKKFADRFNSYFKSDISVQSITYLMGLFKSVDPSFNAGLDTTADENIKKLWIYYIEQNRIQELKAVYQSFKKTKVEPILVDDDASIEAQIEAVISKDNFTFGGDNPKPLYDEKKSETKTNKRDLLVSSNALKLADFKCEFDSNHETFIRKKVDINYTEGHHLIPLEYQYMFDVNLDVEANVVSLCSNCHNQIHYGRDYEVIIKKLFEKRRERLEKCGIKITVEQLLDMYK